MTFLTTKNMELIKNDNLFFFENENIENILIFAVECKSFNIVSHLFQTYQTNNDTLLLKAITNNDSKMVKLLLDHGLTANDNCLLEAVKHNKSFDIIKLLLETNDIDINTKNSYALTISAERGQIDIVTYLLLKGAIITNACLCFTALKGHFEIVNLFLDRGVDISKENFRLITWCLTQKIYKIVYDIIENRKLFVPLYILENPKYSFLYKRYVKLQKFKERMLHKAATKIYFWWIPICYDVNRECGKRMMERSWQRVENYYKI